MLTHVHSACIATLVRFKFIRDFSISEDVTCKIAPFHAKFSTSFKANSFKDAMVPLSIASFIEVALGCICASLATLRPLIQRILIRTRKGQSFAVGSGADAAADGSSQYDSLQKSWHSRDVVEVDELSTTRSNSRV